MGRPDWDFDAAPRHTCSQVCTETGLSFPFQWIAGLTAQHTELGSVLLVGGLHSVAAHFLRCLAILFNTVFFFQFFPFCQANWAGNWFPQLSVHE